MQVKDMRPGDSGWAESTDHEARLAHCPDEVHALRLERQGDELVVTFPPDRAVRLDMATDAGTVLTVKADPGAPA